MKTIKGDLVLNTCFNAGSFHTKL